jgi:hypothetical protein
VPAAWARCIAARDRKLGRDVALKVVPDTFALDPDRLGRFQREAHVLASWYRRDEIGCGLQHGMKISQPFANPRTGTKNPKSQIPRSKSQGSAQRLPCDVL